MSILFQNFAVRLPLSLLAAALFLGHSCPCASAQPPVKLASLDGAGLFTTTSDSSLFGSETLLSWSGQPETASEDDEDSITTDRPDFTEASSTVGRGVAQIEFGYTHSVNDDGGITTRTHSVPEALFRIGTPVNWIELRLAANHLRETTGATTFSGDDDLYVGTKLGLTLQDGILPEMAIMPQMTVPSGDTDLTADRVLAGANFLYGWDINESLSTGGSTQFNRQIDGMTGGGYTEWAQSWTVGFSLNDRLSAYTEWFALIPQDADTMKTEHYADGGFTFLITNDIQFDVRGGVGLNEAANDYFVGTGLSLRFR